MKRDYRMQVSKIMVITLIIIISTATSCRMSHEERLEKYLETIDRHEMMEWMETITDERYNGRLAGTPEYMEVAEWVADKLESWGVSPAVNGSYFQMFDQPYTVIHDVGALKLHRKLPDGTTDIISYQAPDQYYPGMNSGSGELTAEVVYVGYGITAPELNYDDYAGVDVEGKIVLVNRDAPFRNTRDPEYARWLPYCYHQYKVKNAHAHGAAGFLYIDGASANPNIAYIEDLIVKGIGSEPLNDIFDGTGKSNRELLAGINSSFRPASFNTGKVMTIRANTSRVEDGVTCNVIGIIEGTDPDLKHEVIIVGGHLDAVGNAGGLLVNGAIDNASGVVDIMGAAKAMATSRIPLRRSVMFMFIGAEEVGLVGSELYTNAPLFPKENTVVYINLDMAGNGTGISVRGSYRAGGLLDFFIDANDNYVHRPLRANAPEVETPSYGRPRSDAVIFDRAGFRTMSVGTTNPVHRTIYHRPGDDISTITIDIMEDIARMLYVGLIDMANADELDLR